MEGWKEGYWQSAFRPPACCNWSSLWFVLSASHPFTVGVHRRISYLFFIKHFDKCIWRLVVLNIVSFFVCVFFGREIYHTQGRRLLRRWRKSSSSGDNILQGDTFVFVSSFLLPWLRSPIHTRDFSRLCPALWSDLLVVEDILVFLFDYTPLLSIFLLTPLSFPSSSISLLSPQPQPIEMAFFIPFFPIHWLP